MGRPPKPLEQKRRTGRTPGRDSGGRELPKPAAVAQLPGVGKTPDVPDELRTSELAESCFITRGRIVAADRREDVRPCEACAADLGVESWNRLWAAGRTWLSITTDVDVLKRICRARIDEAHLRIALREDGPFVQGQRGGLVAHPAFSQLRTLNSEVVKLESLCGFTPSDRGRLGVAEVEEKSELQILLEKRDPARRAAAVPQRAAPRRRAVGSREDEVD
jgi:P27 family predicted phage terminase small subunit